MQASVAPGGAHARIQNSLASFCRSSGARWDRGELVPGLWHHMHGHAMRGWPHPLLWAHPMPHALGSCPWPKGPREARTGARTWRVGAWARASQGRPCRSGAQATAGRPARRRSGRRAPRTTTSVPPLPPVASGQLCRRSAPPAAAAPACDMCHYMSVCAHGCDITVFGTTGDAAEPAVAGRVRDSSCPRSEPPAAAAAWQQSKGRKREDWLQPWLYF